MAVAASVVVMSTALVACDVRGGAAKPVVIAWILQWVRDKRVSGGIGSEGSFAINWSIETADAERGGVIVGGGVCNCGGWSGGVVGGDSHD